MKNCSGEKFLSLSLLLPKTKRFFSVILRLMFSYQLSYIFETLFSYLLAASNLAEDVSVIARVSGISQTLSHVFL